MQAKRRRLSLRAGLLLAVIFTLGGYLGFIGWHAASAWRAVQILRSLADTSGTAMPVEPAAQALLKAGRELHLVRRALDPLLPFFTLFKGLPGAAGQWLGQIEPLLVYGDETAAAAGRLAQGALPALQSTAQGGGLPTLLAALETGRADFQAARAALERAAPYRPDLDFGILPPRYGDLLKKLDARFPLLQGGSMLLSVLPELAGMEGERTYLLLAQNQDELRGSGGFISAFGLLKVNNGAVTGLDLVDSYAVDNFSVGYPRPPEALRTYMLAGYWVPRDANWSPDFPSAARQVRALYEASTGARTDGVIAFDQRAIEMMLAAVGPVQVAGTPEAVNASNVRRWMQESWAPAPGQGISDDWWLNRKAFMGSLGRAMIDRALAARDRESLLGVTWAAVEAMQSGHLMIWFGPPDAQAALSTAGLDGAVRPEGGDFLMAVDSNVGFNKADAVVHLELLYRIDLRDPAAPRARLEALYRHNGAPGAACRQEAAYGLTYTDMTARCYWDAWRVLAPGGSVLLDAQARPVPAQELLNGRGWDGRVEPIAGENGAQAFTGLLVLRPGEQAGYTLEWALPARVVVAEDGRLKYSLRVQKQSGVNGIDLRIEALLPPGAQPFAPGVDWSPAGTDGVWTWQGLLTQALELELTFER